MTDDKAKAIIDSMQKYEGDANDFWSHAYTLIQAAFVERDARIKKLEEALKHYAKGAPYIGFDRGEIAQEALIEE